MHCKTCDYPLWGITSRTCPECGAPFAPSEFALTPNAVRFCCPHCRQQYFGTDANGHLDPPEFDCVTCGTHIHMDEMVLEPREGVDDRGAVAGAVNPWLTDRKATPFRAFWRTVGKAIGSPVQLGRATPTESSTAPATVFYAICVLIVTVCAIGPFVVISLFSHGSGPGIGYSSSLAPVAIPVVILFFVLFISTVITHLVLLVAAGAPVRFSSTYNAIAYTCPPILIMSIPCVGFWIFPIPMIWWMCSAIGMLSGIHRISRRRAAIAHILSVAITIGAPVGFVSYSIAQGVRHIRAALPSIHTMQATSALLSALGTTPTPTTTHVLDRMRTIPSSLTDLTPLADSVISPPDILIAGHTITDFLALPASQRDPMLADLRAAVLPSGIYRLSNLVICDAGVDLHAPQHPDLWIAIVWPDPDSGAAFLPNQTVRVLTSLVPQTTDIPVAQFPAELVTQNALRRAHNIPEIPDPDTIHMWPAGSQFGPGAQNSSAPVP